MTQQQNPKQLQLPDKANSKTKKSYSPTTTLGKITENLLINIWEPLDLIGKALMGKLWRDVYLTIQDAIGLGILFIIFGYIFRKITGENFAGFDQCWHNWNIWNVNRYFCLVVVALSFTSCIILGGRIIIRFLKDFFDIFKN